MKENNKIPQQARTIKRNKTWMVSILTMLVVAGIAGYVLIVNLVKPDFLNNAPYTSSVTETVTDSSGIENNILEAINEKESYGKYFKISKVTLTSAGLSGESNIQKEIIIIPDDGTNNFSIKDEIETGRELIFKIDINNNADFVIDDTKAVVTLPAEFENIKLLKSDNNAYYEPSSNKIIIKDLGLNFKRSTTLMFTAQDR